MLSTSRLVLRGHILYRPHDLDRSPEVGGIVLERLDSAPLTCRHALISNTPLRVSLIELLYLTTLNQVVFVLMCKRSTFPHSLTAFFSLVTLSNNPRRSHGRRGEIYLRAVNSNRRRGRYLTLRQANGPAIQIMLRLHQLARTS